MHKSFLLANSVSPIPNDLVDAVHSLPLSHRSVLVKCCQAQLIPTPDDPPSTLRTFIETLPPFIYHSQYDSRTYSVHNPLQYFQKFRSFMGPVTCALILDLCRSLGCQPFEIDEARVNSWRKEGICIERIRLPGKINWAPFFHSERCDEVVVEGVRPNPPMARLWLQNLVRWRDRIAGRTLFPRATYKNVSRSTRREFERQTGVNLDNVPILSQKHLLFWQRRLGTHFEGATELRQKWYHHGVKPRTYYAQGGTHYNSSCFLQDVFTELTSCSPITHHLSRLMPTRLVLTSTQDRYLVYDLSTFTSNMTEQRSFMGELSEFCFGTEVTIMDPIVGRIHKDLGDLMTDYTNQCVWFPEVSYERCQEKFEDPKLTDHGSASCLGIFGNLMTCTVAHGMVVSTCVHDESSINVAGDDGLVLENDENESEIHMCICSVGDYEESKTFHSTEEGCICLKRPLRQVAGSLEQGLTCIPPSISLYNHYIRNFTDPRLSFYDDKAGTYQGFSVVGKDLMRFLRSVHRAQWKLDSDEIEFACETWRRFTRELRCKENLTFGLLPQCGDPFFWPALPSEETIRYVDPLRLLVENRYQGSMTGRVFESVPKVPLRDMVGGRSYFVNMSKELVLMETLGFIESVPVEREYVGVEGFNNLIHVLFSKPPPVLYEVSVLNSIPSEFW